MGNEPGHTPDDIIRRLQELADAATQLKEEVDRAAERAAERRKLGIDRRRQSRSDRRKPQ